MSRYWFQIGQTVYGGSTGYTQAEMLGFIAKQQVLEDTLVNVDRTSWIAANKVSALQQAIADTICAECWNKPYNKLCNDCFQGIVGYENLPWKMREYLGYPCRICDGYGNIRTCPLCRGSGKKPRP